MKDILLKVPFLILMGSCLLIIGFGAYRQSNLIERQLAIFQNSHESEFRFYEQWLQFTCNSKKELTFLMNTENFYRLDKPVGNYKELGKTLAKIYRQSLKIQPYSMETRNLTNELQLTLQNGVNASYELAKLVTGPKTVKRGDTMVESIQYYNFFTLLPFSALIPKEDQKRFKDLAEVLVEVSSKIAGFRDLTNTIKGGIAKDANKFIIKLGHSFNNPLNNILVSAKKKELGLLRLKKIITTSQIFERDPEGSCDIVKPGDDSRSGLKLESAYKRAVRLQEFN
ncbi:hypothetical protein [Arenibacter sp. ARW7G5Y1]|uniref:hypothetical protein n=1 Tax=Arenibacter sp. ARW7G5Y1 TaxID=2135619 RepID=UPI000D83FD53|nr:hypothetical protein [Arenibacter sp. ARW7G5Y1]PXX31218.1 hypothetical protein C7972_10153 [Arenibacter sp. ARW7G5Y1]|tara:strand:- start:3707 stop:4555 length:849 start_codon:yes stop_codon:yes gene_type:complete